MQGFAVAVLVGMGVLVGEVTDCGVVACEVVLVEVNAGVLSAEKDAVVVVMGIGNGIWEGIGVAGLGPEVARLDAIWAHVGELTEWCML